MIGKLKGLIDSYGEDYVILDVGGVGYQVHCSGRTLQALPSPGEAAVLSIETYVREDQIKLFGFRSDLEREWFRLLQTVQGVGAKVALAVLGTLPPAELANAIALRDKAAVSRTPGVGPKVAERIVTELKDKAPAFANVDPALVHLSAPGHRRDLGAGQSRLRPAAGRGRDCGGFAQRRRESGNRAADPAGAEGTGEVSVGTSNMSMRSFLTSPRLRGEVGLRASAIRVRGTFRERVCRDSPSPHPLPASGARENNQRGSPA